MAVARALTLPSRQCEQCDCCPRELRYGFSIRDSSVTIYLMRPHENVPIASAEPQYVGFWIRVVATLIDTVLLIAITAPLLIGLYGPAYFRSDAIVQGPMDIVISWFLPAVLVIWFWRAKQATPGKMVFSARIVDATTGAPPSVRQSVGRYLGYLVSTIPFGLGLLWVAFDKRKQGWHDKLAGTVVVRARRANP